MDTLFQPASFFMLRAPSLPIKRYDQMIQKENCPHGLLNWFHQSTAFRQAILIASPELYRATLQFELKDKRRQEQIVASLLNYYARMCSRCTPFGLFSFVAFGKWGERVHNTLHPKQLKKQARPDMEWLYRVVDRILENRDYFPLLPVTANPLLTFTRDRVHLNYIRKKSDTEKGEKTLSIRLNPLTSSLLEIAQRSISIQDMENLLLKRHSFLDREKTRGVIRQLLDQEILISTLHPSLLTHTPYAHFLEKIEELPIELEEFVILKTIQQKIEEYNATSFDEGENLLLDLLSLMEQVAKSPHYLQLDMAAGGALRLPNTFHAEIAEAVTFTWMLSKVIRSSAPNNLTNYHAKFIEKYGYQRRLPLLELLDHHSLGIPQAYTDTEEKGAAPSKIENHWKQFLLSKLSESLHSGKKEIELTEELLSRLGQTDESQVQIPLGFDLQCRLSAPSSEELEKGNYLVQLFSFSFQLGSFFGRFLDLLGVEAKGDLNQLFTEEQLRHGHAQSVELSYLPLYPRSANVAIHPCLRQNYLDLSAKNTSTVHLEEIYVGADSHGFYFSNREGDIEWIFKSGNVLTTKIAPIPIRFLRDASQARQGRFVHAYWADLGAAPFLPRLRYRKAILSPAQWSLDRESLEARNENDLTVITKKLQDWFERWDVPHYVYLTESDHQLLIDTHSSAPLQELARRIKKGEWIQLVEKIEPQTQPNWFRFPEESHLSEIVIPFLRSPKKQALSARYIPQVHTTCPKDRLKILGSDWLYMSTYVPQTSQNRFLLQQLTSLTQDIVNQKIVKQWFFIRYSDPLQGEHLRIRFHGEEEKLHLQLLPIINDWSQKLFEERIIRDLHFGTYERELERYGGKEMIALIENYFCIDTQVTLDLLALGIQSFKNIPIYILAAISLIDFVHYFGGEKKKSPSLVSNQDKTELKGIREWKQILFHYGFPILEGQLTSVKEEKSSAFAAIFEKRRHLLCSLADKQDGHGDSFFHSLIHMHCNRLLGIDQSLEQKARLFANRVIEAYASMKGRSQFGRSSLSSERRVNATPMLPSKKPGLLTR